MPDINLDFTARSLSLICKVYGGERYAGAVVYWAHGVGIDLLAPRTTPPRSWSGPVQELERAVELSLATVFDPLHSALGASYAMPVIEQVVVEFDQALATEPRLPKHEILALFERKYTVATNFEEAGCGV